MSGIFGFNIALYNPLLLLLPLTPSYSITVTHTYSHLLVILHHFLLHLSIPQILTRTLNSESHPSSDTHSLIHHWLPFQVTYPYSFIIDSPILIFSHTHILTHSPSFTLINCHYKSFIFPYTDISYTHKHSHPCITSWLAFSFLNHLFFNNFEEISEWENCASRVGVWSVWVAWSSYCVHFHVRQKI